MKPEEALRLLGKNSRWHIRTYLFYAMGVLLCYPLMIMSPVFLGEIPDYRCKISENATLEESIPHYCEGNSSSCTADRCSIFSINSSYPSSTEKCNNGFWFNPSSHFQSTLATEFELTCGREWLVELSMVLAKTGGALGVVFGCLADRFGRWKILLISCFTNTLIAIAQAFSINMIMYSTLAFFDGFTEAGMINTGICLLFEIYPKEQHALVGVGLWMFWALGYVLLVPFVYFIKTWRLLQLAITLPMVFFSIMYIWFIDESIPWLVANGKFEKAEKIFQKAAVVSSKLVPEVVFGTQKEDVLLTGYRKQTNTMRKNGREKVNHDFSADATELNTSLGELEEEDIEYTPKDLLKHPRLCCYTVILWFVWFVNYFSYGAITYTVTYLPGNMFVNLFWYAALEIPAYLLLYFTMEKWGKRLPSVLFHIVAGIVLCACVIQTTEWGQDQTLLLMILSQTGKFCFTYTFGAIYLIPPDMYPTNFRSTGLGMCQFFGKLGDILNPYSRILARQFPWVPSMVFGVLSILAGLMLLVLPETQGKTLPKTMQEVEAYRHVCDCVSPEPDSDHSSSKAKEAMM